jgi:hypothetical protein
MYYSHPCSYCGKVFYTYLDGDRYKAAEILHDRIVEHLHAYGEHDKEYDFDDGREIDMMEVYNQLSESSSPPENAYIVYEGAVLPKEYNQLVTSSDEPITNQSEAIVKSSSSKSSYSITISLALLLLLLIVLLLFI